MERDNTSSVMGECITQLKVHCKRKTGNEICNPKRFSFFGSCSLSLFLFCAQVIEFDSGTVRRQRMFILRVPYKDSLVVGYRTKHTFLLTTSLPVSGPQLIFNTKFPIITISLNVKPRSKFFGCGRENLRDTQVKGEGIEGLIIIITIDKLLSLLLSLSLSCSCKTEKYANEGQFHKSNNKLQKIYSTSRDTRSIEKETDGNETDVAGTG